MGTPDTTPNWLQISFTNPSRPASQHETGGPDEILAAAIRKARLSVDMAALHLSLPSLHDALLEAARRGVMVRLVVESGSLDSTEIQDLVQAGIPVVGDAHPGLMEDRFVVIDQSEVWTGSMDYTIAGAYQDNGDLLRITSSQVVEDFSARFEDMFRLDRFGPDAVADTPFPGVTSAGIYLQVLFPPADPAAQTLLQLIAGAKGSIDFLANSFTSADLGAALVHQSKAGVVVRGVMDRSQVVGSPGTEYDAFLLAGLDVGLSPDGNGRLRHQVLIIDHRIVVTGSYGFSASADSTDDSSLIIFYDPGIAGMYEGEFEHIFDTAHP